MYVSDTKIMSIRRKYMELTDLLKQLDAEIKKNKDNPEKKITVFAAGDPAKRGVKPEDFGKLQPAPGLMGNLTL
jgi:hypothetical protein